jgi:transposase
MLIIGCDFHPAFQQVAMFDSRTGEIEEKRLQRRAEAEQFYRALAGREIRVGREACGHYPWFERLLEELGFELWFGDAARVRASEVRKQKTQSICWNWCGRIVFRGSGCRAWRCGMCGSCCS